MGVGGAAVMTAKMPREPTVREEVRRFEVLGLTLRSPRMASRGEQMIDRLPDVRRELALPEVPVDDPERVIAGREIQVSK